MVGLGLQEHLSLSNILWALVSSAGTMSGSATPQSCWLEDGCNSGVRGGGRGPPNLPASPISIFPWKEG